MRRMSKLLWRYDGEVRSTPPRCQLLRLWGSARVAVTMLIEVARLMAWMVMMLAWLLGHACVAVSVLVEIAGGMAGMRVMLARAFAARRVAVTILVDVARLVPRMVVMLFVVMIGHGSSP